VTGDGGGFRRSAAGLGANLALAAISLSVVVLGTEAIFRLAGIHRIQAYGFGRHLCMQRSWLLGHELMPSCVGEFTRTPFRTNALGLRGDELTEDAAVRILALGDSCTWGYRVAEHQSYPAVLQRLLDTRAGRGRYRVLNAGVPGYSSYQGVGYLAERAAALHPAVVLIGFQYNDSVTDGDVAERLAVVRRMKPIARVADYLYEHSRVYRWAHESLRQASPPPRVPRVRVDEYGRNLERMVTLSRGLGAEPVMIDWNVPELPAYRARLAAVAAANDVLMVKYYGQRLGEDPVHPTVEGYEDLAARLFDLLAANQLVRATDG
jgi:lysophospholipase L1-like esterase